MELKFAIHTSRFEHLQISHSRNALLSTPLLSKVLALPVQIRRNANNKVINVVSLGRTSLAARARSLLKRKRWIKSIWYTEAVHVE